MSTDQAFDDRRRSYGEDKVTKVRVLLATEDITFSVGLREEYVRRGFEVQIGTQALLEREGTFDLIHSHWPEELVGWKTAPQSREIDQMAGALEWWAKRSTLVCSVHNLQPHLANAGDENSSEYYREFYARMHHIGHFSATSLREVSERYPAIESDKHFVHGMNLFDDIGRLSIGREASRRALGLRDDDFVVLTFGHLRSAGETTLLEAGLDGVRSIEPVVLLYSRPPDWRSPSGALSRLRHELWCLQRPHRRHRRRVANADAAIAFEAADALVVPRFGGHLNSGLLPFAMTFGTPLVAPDYGIWQEYLAGTPNELYTPADAAALARAVERLAAKPAAQTRASNRQLASAWGWPHVVDRILERIG